MLLSTSLLLGCMLGMVFEPPVAGVDEEGVPAGADPGVGTGTSTGSGSGTGTGTGAGDPDACANPYDPVSVEGGTREYTFTGSLLMFGTSVPVDGATSSQRNAGRGSDAGRWIVTDTVVVASAAGPLTSTLSGTVACAGEEPGGAMQVTSLVDGFYDLVSVLDASVKLGDGGDALSGQPSIGTLTAPFQYLAPADALNAGTEWSFAFGVLTPPHLLDVGGGPVTWDVSGTAQGSYAGVYDLPGGADGHAVSVVYAYTVTLPDGDGGTTTKNLEAEMVYVAGVGVVESTVTNTTDNVTLTRALTSYSGLTAR